MVQEQQDQRLRRQEFNYLPFTISKIVSVAEWLRRYTRNVMGYARAGSNPAADVLILSFFVPLLHDSVTTFVRSAMTNRGLWIVDHINTTVH